MKNTIALIIILSISLIGCDDYNLNRLRTMNSTSSSVKSEHAIPMAAAALINEDGATIAERIKMPEGFERVEVREDSFGAYLRNFPVKPHDTPVMHFDGTVKPAEVHVAVLDIEIGDRNLQQCADAVIRLRAEYLYEIKEYDKIHFDFTSGFEAAYSKWRQGNTISVEGNHAAWFKASGPTEDYESFRKYLDMVFAYAGTISLSKEMKQTSIGDMQIGDVFIIGGSPGHCVIIVDMAQNKETGQKLFLLAQSYMPAQDIHILKNPQNPEGNPWYFLEPGQTLDTPEWDFTSDDLRRFE